MGKTDSDSSKHDQKKTARWVTLIFIITILLSGMISFVSEALLSGSGIAAAFAILFVIVLVGIIFDIIGVAVTSANERPFHSMAARKVPGAQEAIRLLRSAERVSSFCNDVVGDVCGIISGSASATIAARVIQHFSFSAPKVTILVMSAMIAGLTVGGKAIGKAYAINSCTEIVHNVGRTIHTFRKLLSLFRQKTRHSSVQNRK